MTNLWRRLSRRMAGHGHRLRYELLAFSVVGLLQAALDTLVFIGLGVLGVPVFVANAIGRLAGACLGFVINGRVTFASSDDHGLDLGAVLRFVAIWLVLTTVGGILLVRVEQGFGLTGTWLAKPMVEAVLAVFGFLTLKYFVFAKRFR